MPRRRLIPVVLAAFWLSSGAAAADGIMITDAFARASAGAAKNAAAFMTLKNHSGRDDHLVAVRTARARKAELHTHIHDQGVMRMRPVARITVPAGRRPCHVDRSHGAFEKGRHPIADPGVRTRR